MLARGIALAVSLLAQSAGGDSIVETGDWLSWAAPATAGCGGLDAFSGEVERRLGRAPGATADALGLSVAVRVERILEPAPHWLAELRVRTRDGAPEGVRTIERADDTCAPITTTLALMVALVLQPSAPAAPPPAPPPTAPRPPPAPRADPRHRGGLVSRRRAARRTRSRARADGGARSGRRPSTWRRAAGRSLGDRSPDRRTRPLRDVRPLGAVERVPGTERWSDPESPGPRPRGVRARPRALVVARPRALRGGRGRPPARLRLRIPHEHRAGPLVVRRDGRRPAAPDNRRSIVRGGGRPPGGPPRARPHHLRGVDGRDLRFTRPPRWAGRGSCSSGSFCQ